ncbi:hypothetical protein HDU86_002935, partial [Geranomyces michiganensis]
MASSSSSSSSSSSLSPPRSLGFRAWQAVIAIIVLVTPLAYLYIASLLLYCLRNSNSNNSSAALLLISSLLPSSSLSKASIIALTLLTAWMLIETLWYPYHLLTANRLRARRDPAHVATTPQERRVLYKRCLAALAQGSDVRKAIEGWFFGAPIHSIGRENLVQWFAWAMWDTEPHALSQSELAEIDLFIKDTERAVSDDDDTTVLFRPGYFNPDVTCMRLTIDDMQMLHRPFVYYVVISAMHAMASVFLWSQGFEAKE